MSTEAKTPMIWIGVKNVAEELNISERAAWELIRRSGVKMLNERSVKLARFLRTDWEEARANLMKAATPRSAQVRTPVTAQAATSRLPGQPNPKLAQLRKD